MSGGFEAQPPLICHVVYRFDTGGLENGVVNLINHMPRAAARHMVVALTEVSEGFAARVRRRDVEFVALRKRPGHGVRLYPDLVRLLERCRPAVVHTRNLAALEMQPAAAWAGVPLRVHGEHGRDADDIDGSNRRHQWVRRAYSPFVHRYVALSRDLGDYLVQRVGIGEARVRQIYNGVDTLRFRPAEGPGGGREPLPGSPFNDPRLWVVGTVGRMMTVKAQPDLARAFVLALQRTPALRERLRLVMVGEGPLRAEAQAILDAAGVAGLTWLPGERHDVPEVMRALDAFVLPSVAEGVSNTILEAMASGLPVLATAVGGNAELVSARRTGLIVPAGDAAAMADGLARWATQPDAARSLGRAGRVRAMQRFSLQAMVDAYLALYRGADSAA
ncbi:MAG: TIGR03088 family PEP-CTERM/XrtA system glycosyltransferase [Betaproteobacteria bacterium]|nr:TIGR03088 family PEP-CTERM/XrtA system glycosyltransferase [Betaproteobacteria bacterium]